MELRQLRTFIKLAEVLNFSEASKLLYLTQSTISQQIKNLEQELGTLLFIRNSHCVVLTECGEELLPYARKTVADADECHQRMVDLQEGVVGELNIGVTYSFSPILTETIFTFMKRFRGIKLNICYKPMSELMEMLRCREIDFVLAFKPTVSMDGIESHTLFHNYLAAIVNSSNPLAKRENINMNELSKYSLALPSQGLQARNVLQYILEKHPVKLDIRVELNDPNILLELIRGSNMVSVLAESSVHRQQGVVAIPLHVPENEMIGCVHTLSGSYHKKATCEFVKLLSESLAVKERANAWL